MKGKERTVSAKPKDVTRKWYLVNAEEKVLGRLASRVAQILRGKHKTNFTPHVDTGDHVVVINAEKVLATGKKEEKKQYFTHSGYPGGHKLISLEVMREKHPERVITAAVKGMLPKNRLRAKIIKKLKVCRGSSHPHQAQKPEALEV